MLRNKIKKIGNFVQKNVLPVLTGVAVFGAMVLVNGALASNKAQEMMTWIIRALGILPLVPGVINGVTGLSAYGQAHAEGDGPAENKAKKQLSGAVMLIVVSIIIIAGASTLAGFISTSV